MSRVRSFPWLHTAYPRCLLKIQNVTNLPAKNNWFRSIPGSSSKSPRRFFRRNACGSHLSRSMRKWSSLRRKVKENKRKHVHLCDPGNSLGLGQIISARWIPTGNSYAIPEHSSMRRDEISREEKFLGATRMSEGLISTWDRDGSGYGPGTTSR